MSHLPNRGSPNVFVGNIPYEQTEEQLKEVFSQAGHVVDFRLVVDPDTRRPKGYGFCQFEDAETAASAIRNLNGVMVSGRALRLDSGGDPKDRSTSGLPPTGRGPPVPAYDPPNMAPIPPAAPSFQPAASTPTSDQATTATIQATLSHMPPNQLLDILTQMRTFALQSPDQAKTVLTSHPQLAYALFQAMLMMNIVNPIVLQQLSAGIAPTAPTAPTAPIEPVAPPPPTYPPPPAGYAYPPPSAYPPPAPASAPTPVAPLPEEQRALLQQVLSLPQAEIDKLDPEQRSTIMALRAQYGGGQV